jgi:hypothetical protein
MKNTMGLTKFLELKGKTFPPSLSIQNILITLHVFFFHQILIFLKFHEHFQFVFQVVDIKIMGKM